MKRRQEAASVPAEQHLAGGLRAQDLPALGPHAAAQDGFQRLRDLQRRLHRLFGSHSPAGRGQAVGRTPGSLEGARRGRKRKGRGGRRKAGRGDCPAAHLSDGLRGGPVARDDREACGLPGAAQPRTRDPFPSPRALGGCPPPRFPPPPVSPRPCPAVGAAVEPLGGRGRTRRGRLGPFQAPRGFAAKPLPWTHIRQLLSFRSRKRFGAAG